MAYGLHTLLSFRGKIGVSGDVIEDWSFGIRIAGTSAPNDTTVVAAAGVHDAMVAAVGYISDTPNAFAPNVTFNEVRAYRIDAAGHARGPATIDGPSSPTHGTGSTPLHPWQCSNVISLVHNGIGPGRKGRVYLPPQTYPVDNTGHISLDNAAAARSGFAGFLAAVIAPAYEGTVTRPVIASKTYGSLLTVNELRCGLVTDTQRRRRNKENEHYDSGVFPG